MGLVARIVYRQERLRWAVSIDQCIKQTRTHIEITLADCNDLFSYFAGINFDLSRLAHLGLCLKFHCGLCADVYTCRVDLRSLLLFEWGRILRYTGLSIWILRHCTKCIFNHIVKDPVQDMGWDWWEYRDEGLEHMCVYIVQGRAKSWYWLLDVTELCRILWLLGFNSHYVTLSHLIVIDKTWTSLTLEHIVTDWRGNSFCFSNK